jgi:uncharacterized protein
MIKKLVLVDDYLTSLDPIKERTLRAVLEFILSEFPHLEVKNSWNVPQIHCNGMYVFGVSALKNHLALAPWSSRVIEDFRQRLETDKYVVRKNLFQIPVDWEIDTELLTDLIRARLELD